MNLKSQSGRGILGWVVAAVLCLPLTACQDAEPAPVGQGELHPEKGEALVTSVDGPSHLLHVRQGDQNITAWWDQNTTFFDGTVAATPADLKPGDVITFKGLEANGETYVGVVQIVRKTQ